jgi:hypothetical protein
METGGLRGGIEEGPPLVCIRGGIDDGPLLDCIRDGGHQDHSSHLNHKWVQDNQCHKWLGHHKDNHDLYWVDHQIRAMVTGTGPLGAPTCGCIGGLGGPSDICGMETGGLRGGIEEGPPLRKYLAELQQSSFVISI